MLLLQKQMELLKLSKQKNIIATGSKPSSLPFIKIDKERIITSTEALKQRFQNICYWWWSYRNRIRSEVYLRLGAQVSVVEYLDRIIPGMDASLSKELTKVLKKQGMKFYVSHKVKSVERNGEGVCSSKCKKEKQLRLKEIISFCRSSSVYRWI
jgi:pyruvate/2-oxoglutarate dehydrogenase complex dihydrolipoamide dehydrogenase (E3) component